MKRNLFPAILIIVPIIFTASLNAEPFRYDSHGKRDPMIPLIGQDKGTGGMVAFADIATIDDVKLEGIAYLSSGSRTAIINGELVREGFKAGEAEVRKIEKNAVVLSISGKEYTVPLYEEGGQK